VFPLRSGAEALHWLESHRPHLMLLDVRMPEMDGYTLCSHIKAQPQLADIPVIFISAADGVEDKVRGFDVGGLDYITKPFEEREVLARVATHVRLSELQHLLNQQILELQAANVRIYELSIRDGLTGVYNRRYFQEQFAPALYHAEVNNQALAVALADIDFFKRVNDQFSHAVGDAVLCQTAQLLRVHARDGGNDLLARYGGEEFVLMLPQCDLQTAHSHCERLRQAIEAAPWADIHPDLRVTMSFGVASWTPATPTPYPEQVLHDADSKLYEAKRLGRNRVCS
jgi:diguanylate cyclase (GGDEF)-like protein